MHAHLRDDDNVVNVNDDYASSGDNYYSADYELDDDYHADCEHELVDDNSVRRAAGAKSEKPQFRQLPDLRLRRSRLQGGVFDVQGRAATVPMQVDDGSLSPLKRHRLQAEAFCPMDALLGIKRMS